MFIFIYIVSFLIVDIFRFYCFFFVYMCFEYRSYLNIVLGKREVGKKKWEEEVGGKVGVSKKGDSL